LQPGDLAVEIRRVLELLDSDLAMLLQELDAVAELATVEVRALDLDSELASANAELVEQVDLLDQALQALCQGIERLAGRVLGLIAGGWVAAVLGGEGVKILHQGFCGPPRKPRSLPLARRRRR